ncbi:hypothetical protein BKA80DRAFT_275222 [Phyllosticta citrichinensis]
MLAAMLHRFTPLCSGVRELKPQLDLAPASWRADQIRPASPQASLSPYQHDHTRRWQLLCGKGGCGDETVVVVGRGARPPVLSWLAYCTLRLRKLPFPHPASTCKHVTLFSDT